MYVLDKGFERGLIWFWILIDLERMFKLLYNFNLRRILWVKYISYIWVKWKNVWYRYEFYINM